MVVSATIWISRAEAMTGAAVASVIGLGGILEMHGRADRANSGSDRAHGGQRRRTATARSAERPMGTTRTGILPAMNDAPAPAATDPCPLCTDTGGTLVLRNALLRVVLVDDTDYPGFCRVILNHHAREMTELSPAEIARVMGVVFAVEDAQRTVLAPLKINLASFGNVVPHVHWHVIPRFADDAHFPQPVWGTRQREPDADRLATRRAQLPRLMQEIVARVPATPAD
jgi:diadenosine tetraphosphate (Ap4A) HIT family hydrolase